MEDIQSPAGSEQPSEGSDFYGTDASKAEQQPTDAPAVVPDEPVTGLPSQVNGIHHAEEADGAGDADEDSSSEMDVSVSESSRESTPEAAPEEPSHAGSKRKASDAIDTLDALEQALEEPSKKQKLSPPLEPVAVNQPSPAERLPIEYWQHIFLRLSPAMLSRCLRVCKSFNTILTGTKAQQPVAKKDQKKKLQVRTLDSETIWTEARKLYFPNMPRPLMDRTELWMLQLVAGRTCQFCNRPPVPAPATSPFNAGPGPDGLRVIWPFGIRTCGQCWERNTLKDVEVLVTPAATLRSGLAYAFRTPDLHFVPEIQRQLGGGIPSHLRVAKVYYQPDIRAISEEFADIQGYGEGTADEWRKGLGNRGKEKMADAARWERWEQQVRGSGSGYGPAPTTDLAYVLREYDLPSFPRYVEGKSAANGVNGVSGAQPVQATNGLTHQLPQLLSFQHPYQNGHAYGTPFQAQPQSYNLSLPFQPSGRSHPQLHHFRQPHEVESARAARKLEIERRCMQEIEPPLEPSVLQHIDSFQAAMQITTPLNDAQWEMLRPRLLAQREAAEMVEHLRKERAAALQAAIPSVPVHGVHEDAKSMKPVAKDAYEREYEQAQEPLRRRLGEYADETINGTWHAGQGLDRESAPTFAIQVLMHVRKRYLEDKYAGNLPTAVGEEDQAGSTDPKQATPAPDLFLSLDNMKWVHDNKVRPYSDPHRRELFLCAGEGCSQEKRPKWFAFEGLIQHFGAKHTTAFSKGNIVVHWQSAEWPTSLEELPFIIDPSPWIRMDRKAFDSKGHGRGQHRGTPHQQNRGGQQHSGPFGVPPSPGVMLSENPLFQQTPMSNGYHHNGQGLPAYQHASLGGPQRSFSFQAQQHPLPAQPMADMSYEAQINEISSDAREIWDGLDGVRDLLECIRIQTVLHHVVARFKERFHRQPDLDLLTDALATNVFMRPLKNAHGLACHSCVAKLQTETGAGEMGYYARIRNVKLYNASSLITHFKIVHQPQFQQEGGLHGLGHLDWTTTMIELPEASVVAELMRTPGMDDEKLALVVAAFPSAFPMPLPKIGLVTEAPPMIKEVGPDSGLASRLLQRLEKKQKPVSGKKKGLTTANGGTPGRDGSQDPLPEPAEDEYDPRKPSQSQDEASDPLAKFDSDIARKSAGPAAASANAGVPFQLAPETLAALSSLTALQPSATLPEEKEERSPSVGRAEPASAGGSSANGMPAAAPDISAILASLTGHLPTAQQQSATPPANITPRPSRAHGHPHAYGSMQPVQASPVTMQHRPDSRRSSGRYMADAWGAHQLRASVEPSPPARSSAQDLQAVLARNSKGYEQNQQVQAIDTSYAEPPAAYTQAQRSPPRYRYVYEDEAPQHQVYGSHPPPQQQQPMYREAPIQYIQLPPEQSGYPQQQAYPQYQYERQPPPLPLPPRPMYVDEYGRPVELIPIDSAPAPVQYAPHPYEQQQQQQAQYAQRGGTQYGQSVQYQPVYYEQQAPMGAGQARYGNGNANAAVYDESARSSVPRT